VSDGEAMRHLALAGLGSAGLQPSTWIATSRPAGWSRSWKTKSRRYETVHAIFVARAGMCQRACVRFSTILPTRSGLRDRNLVLTRNLSRNARRDLS